MAATANESSRQYTHLVQLEVGGIQSFIFDGSHLREWRGASALLDETDRHTIPQWLAQETTGIHPLRSGGGVHVFGRTAAGPPPEAFSEQVRRRYQAEVPGAQVYVAVAPCGDASVPELLAELSFAVAHARGMAPQSSPGAAALHSLARPCDSCGRQPAATSSVMADAGDLICPVCSRKEEVGIRVRRGETRSNVLSRFAAYLEVNESAGAWGDASAIGDCVPDDLTALARQGDGDIAIILADGNSLGKTLQEISGLEQYHAFSSGIAEAVEAAVFEALSQHPPRPDPSSATASGTVGVLPWEIIFLGGDDVLIVTTDTIALAVVQDMVRALERNTEETLSGFERERLTMGVGMVVSSPHVPMAALLNMAGQLERSAKNRAYDAPEDVSTIDFHRITGSGSASLDHLRGYALRPRRTGGLDVSLTARPLTFDELEEAHHIATTWAESNLPPSKLQAVREQLFVSPAEAMRSWAHTVSRASKDNRSAWLELGTIAPPAPPLQLPWVRRGDGVGTYYLDVFDLYTLLN